MKPLHTIIITTAIIIMTGCATVSMQSATMVEGPDDNVALVTFVRPSIFFGDGVAVDIWDGAEYVGSLGAGRLIQHETTPGKHIFMGNAENWAYATGDLIAGKQYFIKANIFPGVILGRTALGVVKLDDARVAIWLQKLKSVAASEMDKSAAEVKKKLAVENAIANFEAGKVSYATIRPEDAR